MKTIHKKLLVAGAPALLLVLALAGAWYWWRSRAPQPVPVAAAADAGPEGPVVRGMPRHNTGVWPPGPPEDTGIGYSHLLPIDPRTNYNMAPRDNRYVPTR